MEYKKMYRSSFNKKIAGVCGGIAEYLNVDPVIVRLLFFASVFLLHGGTLLVYIAAWIMVPQRPEFNGYYNDYSQYNGPYNYSNQENPEKTQNNNFNDNNGENR